MLRCVAFDLDGVVISSEPSFAMFEADHGITREQFREFFSGPYQDAMLGAVDLESVLEPTIDSWGWQDGLSAFMTTWFRSCEDPEPHVLDLIRRLRRRGLVTCVATNQDNRRAAHLDSLPWLRDHFSSRFFSCRLGVAKPDFRYFERVQSDLSIPASSILFLDDKLENVEAARNVGWQADHVPSPEHLGAVLDRHIEDMSV